MWSEFSGHVADLQEIGCPICPSQMWGPGHCSNLPGHQNWYDETQITPASRKAHTVARDNCSVERQKEVLERELLSLIGQLQHANTVVKPSRVFLSRMISLASTLKGLDRLCHLNYAFRSDLEWWHKFLAGWNVSLFWEVDMLNPDLTLLSDASGQWGCGALMGIQ